MTTNRLLSRIRRNPDFIAATRLLDDLGLSWSISPPRGRGHVILLVEKKLRWPLGSSPGGRINKANVRSQLSARLREFGLI